MIGITDIGIVVAVLAVFGYLMYRLGLESKVL